MSLPQFRIGPLQILILRLDAPTPLRAVLPGQARISIRFGRTHASRMGIAMLPDQFDSFVSCRLEYLALFLREFQILHGNADSTCLALLRLTLFPFAVLHTWCSCLRRRPRSFPSSRWLHQRPSNIGYDVIYTRFRRRSAMRFGFVRGGGSRIGVDNGIREGAL